MFPQPHSTQESTRHFVAFQIQYDQEAQLLDYQCVQEHLLKSRNLKRTHMLVQGYLCLCPPKCRQELKKEPSIVLQHHIYFQSTMGYSPFVSRSLMTYPHILLELLEEMISSIDGGALRFIFFFKICKIDCTVHISPYSVITKVETQW